jgi:hypothetical protein
MPIEIDVSTYILNAIVPELESELQSAILSCQLLYKINHLLGIDDHNLRFSFAYAFNLQFVIGVDLSHKGCVTFA